MKCPKKLPNGRRCNCKAVKRGERAYSGERVVMRYRCSKGHWSEMPTQTMSASA